MTVLSTDQLESYATLLTGLGAPLAQAWEPGLDDKQISEIERELGFALAAEIRTLWQWRTAPQPTRPSDCQFFAERTLLRPADALALRDNRGKFLYDYPKISRRFVPVFSLAQHAVILADSSDPSGPSQLLDFWFEDGAGRTVAHSLGDLVEFAAQQIQQGHVTVVKGKLTRPSGHPRYPIDLSES